MSDQNDQIQITLRANIDQFQKSALTAAAHLDKVRTSTRDVAEENKKATAAADAYIQSLNRQALMLGRNAAEQRVLEVGLQRLTAEQRTHALGVVNSINAYEAHQASMARLSSQMMVLGTAVAAGGTAMLFMMKSGIDAADALNDMHQKTGIAVETLAGYKLVAEQSGTSLEGLAGGVKNLSKFMVENEAELRAAGVTARDADGAMRQLADIFKAMPDGIEQTNLAMKVFGKSGQDMIPVLNLGGEEIGRLIERGRELNPVTAEMAKNADQFNDTMTELKMSVTAVGVSLANDMLPALNAVVGRLAEGMRASGGFVGGIKELMSGALSESQLKSAIDQIDARNQNGDTYDTDSQDRARYERELNRIREAKSAAIVASYGSIDSREGKAYTDRAAMAATGKARALTETGKGKAKGGKKAAGDKPDNFKPGMGMAWDNGGEMGQDNADSIVALMKENDSAEVAAERERVKQERISEEYGNGLARRWEQLQVDNLSKDELELARYETRLAELEVIRGNELITEQMHQDMLAQIQIDAAMKSSSTQMQIAAAQAAWEKMSGQQKTTFLLSQSMMLTAGFALHSKTAFEANKKLSIAQATMTTYDNAVKAFNAYASIPYVGPILGAVAAASAIAFGMAQVSQIKSQQFGGGGGGGGSGVPSMPSYSASSANRQMLEGDTAPGPAQPVVVRGVEAAAKTQVNVTLIGDAFDQKTIAEKLIPLLNEASANGATIVVNH